MNTHNLKIEFGKYRGELYTRLPIHYLRWMIDQHTKDWEIAQAELNRRGAVIEHQLEVSTHAIDRASIRLWKVWIDDTKMKVGIHRWLHDLAVEALGSSKEEKPTKVVYKDIKFVFEHNYLDTVLKTVILKGGKNA